MRFSSFRLWLTLSHWYRDWVKAAPLHVLKNAQMQSETRAMQGFDTKPGTSAAKPNSSKFDLKAVILFFRTRYISFVALEYLSRYCGLKFKFKVIFGLDVNNRKTV